MNGGKAPQMNFLMPKQLAVDLAGPLAVSLKSFLTEGTEA